MPRAHPAPRLRRARTCRRSRTRYASGKDAQEAHEAIRPTDLAYTPERVAPFLPPEQLRLYTLIYNRFVACQMTPAIFAITNVEITAAQGMFKAQGKILKFDGYRKVLARRPARGRRLLPLLNEHRPAGPADLSPTQHFTEPPPRYNEASLVKTLEKEGIGRPSTYASIMSTIQKRDYVEQKERRFFATEVGMKVTDLLVKHFPKVMDLKFTSHMEEELDQIETRKYAAQPGAERVLRAVRQRPEGGRDRRCSADAEKCPVCGKPLVERYSRFGKFFGCSRLSGVQVHQAQHDGRGRSRERTAASKPTGMNCPNCGKPMVQRMGQRGPFLGCSGYPECKTTMNLDAEGKPVLASRPTEHVCDKCGKPMVLREGPRGPFLACTGYPKCQNAKDVDAEGNPVQPIDTGINCEKCGADGGRSAARAARSWVAAPIPSAAAPSRCRRSWRRSSRMRCRRPPRRRRRRRWRSPKPVRTAVGR